MKVEVKNGRMAAISIRRRPGMSVLTVTQASGTPMRVANKVAATATKMERPTRRQ